MLERLTNSRKKIIFAETTFENMEISELYRLFCEHPVVTTDSRDCPEGSIFFALKGASFNGNEFAKSALEKGCAYAVVDEEAYVEPSNRQYILVDDCLQTLQQLATCHRRQLGIPIIGVTGTNGKTTTKELIATVLGERFNVLYTEGNLNNHIGVPKTLLRMTKEHELAVIEMGANHPGEIRELVHIVEPDCGLITNVGKAHLEGFGSFEGVKRTKGELYDFLSAHRTAQSLFINAADDDLTAMAQERWDTPSLSDGWHTYSSGKDGRQADVQGEVIACDPYLRFEWRTCKMPVPQEIDTHLIGSYNINNALAAITVGLAFGVSETQIKHALESYVPSNNRSQLTMTAHNRLVVDTYNANPTSMKAALENFKSMAVSPKMVILGDMRELGASSTEEHQRVVDVLQEACFNEVWLVGDEFSKIDSPFRKFHDVDEVKQALSAQRPEGYYILIKGSNSIRLFQLPELL